MDEEEEVRSFVTKAEENLQTVDKVSELVHEKSVDKLDSPLQSKKTTENVRPTQKELIEKNRIEEGDDDDGLEKKMRNSYIGFKKINLSKLYLAPEIERVSPVNQNRVNFLEAEMSVMFDPCQAVLCVTPKDDGFNIKESDEETEYEVVQGRHRVMAFKNLEDKGKLNKFPGISDGKIPCWILKKELSVKVMGLAKSNHIQAQVRKTSPHEYLYMGQILRECGVNLDTVKETIKRFSRLTSTKPEDITTIGHLLTFTDTQYKAVVETLKLFESYKTKDADNNERGMKDRIRKGECKPLSRRLFRKCNKINGDQFERLYHEVEANTISLNDAIDGIIKENEKNM